MGTFVALLRAVNVGGTGALPMAVLAAICRESGFEAVRTVLASGNAVFRADGTEGEIRLALASRLRAELSREVGVLVRSADEMAAAAAADPFGDRRGDRVTALFTDQALPADPLAGATGHGREEVRLGPRLLFVHYGDGMASSRLRLPLMALGTARNMNTVRRLGSLASQDASVTARQGSHGPPR